MEQHDHLFRIRHSSAHLLAMAVLDLFPEAKLGIGPVIETGFYYDFDLPRALTPEDLPTLETKMNELIRQNIAFVRKPMSKNEAETFFCRSAVQTRTYSRSYRRRNYCL